MVAARLARSNQVKQQELESARAQAERFQAYLEQIENLLLDHQLRSSNKTEDSFNARVVAQAQTFAVLAAESDPSRKRILLLFLYDSELIYMDDPILKLTRANLRKTDLVATVLVQANLSWADLREANLSGAYLNETNLSWADLSGARLNNADLIGTEMSDAHLGNADLRDADLGVANLNNADLSGANLNNATVTDSQLTLAKSLEGATMPDGSKHD